MRIVFMGTPEFAVPSLRILVENGYAVVGVVTQKDKPKDRGHALKAPPVKEYAAARDIPVFQPNKLSKEPETVEQLKALAPDLTVTCAFGQILPQTVLDIPRLGTINVHGSLLPKYRGAAPLQWSIINGDPKTGITTMFTDIGVDTGDMLLKEEIQIPDDMTAGELHDRMSELGAETLLKTIKALEDGQLQRIKQDEALATYAPKIDKETGWINWHKTARQVHNLVRGTTPWPGAFTELSGTRFKICRSKLCQDNMIDPVPGKIQRVDSDGMWVSCGEGAVLIQEIQADSGKRMTPQQYACGHELKPGMVFKSSEK